MEKYLLQAYGFEYYFLTGGTNLEGCKAFRTMVLNLWVGTPLSALCLQKCLRHDS